MSRVTAEFSDFSGVDSRSSPLRLPPGRALRSQNWVVKPNGMLQLRYGYAPIPLTAPFASALHSAAYVEPNVGSPYVLAGNGTSLTVVNVDSIGAKTNIPGMSSGAKWNGIFADGVFLLGNGTDKKRFDGMTLRDMGIRAPSNAEVASVTVSYTTLSAGNWSTTEFSGHQFYLSYFNPITQEMSNRVAIGSRLLIGAPSGSVIVNGLPNLAGVNAEWVKIIGRTPDNGKTPNIFIDSTGAWVVIGNSFTAGTISLPDTDPEAEMPILNDLPPNFDKIAYALSRGYAIDNDDPSAIRYSASRVDAASGLFVGDPRTSWGAAQKQYFPTGEKCRGIQEVDNEVWVWTRNHLGILSEFGGTDSGLGRPTVQWKGTWVGGIAGHRAFAKTPHGPFWVSADKQIMTRGDTGPMPVSRDYEAALLDKISDANLPNVEMGYLLDPAKDLDCLYVWGKDANGNDVFVVHDFGAGNIAHEHIYQNLTISTFVRNPQTVVSARDANGKMRLWVADTTGSIQQLEEGDSDNGADCSADIITVYNSGPKRPTLGALRWFGDGNIRVTVTTDLTLTLGDLGGLDSIDTEAVDDLVSSFKAQIEEKAQFLTVRIQLDGHHADGTLALSSPIPHVPLESYGRLYLMQTEMGLGRDIGGSRP